MQVTFVMFNQEASSPVISTQFPTPGWTLLRTVYWPMSKNTIWVANISVIRTAGARVMAFTPTIEAVPQASVCNLTVRFVSIKAERAPCRYLTWSTSRDHVTVSHDNEMLDPPPQGLTSPQADHPLLSWPCPTQADSPLGSLPPLGLTILLGSPPSGLTPQELAGGPSWRTSVMMTICT